MTIDLHIEELVLHGLPLEDRNAIGEAVRLELARLVGESGIPASLMSGRVVGRIDGGSFDVNAAAGPQAVGARIAASIYGGLRD